MGNRMSARVHNDPPAAARPEQEEQPDGVLGNNADNSLKGTYERIALHIISYMSSDNGDDKIELQKTLKTVLETAQDIVAQLQDAPMGIGTGLKICCSVLRKCQDMLEVEGSIRMLVLDVVMVCELMSSALEALVPQQGVGGQASGQQPSPPQQYNSIANAINGAMRSPAYEAFIASKGGKVHVAYLYMALDVARKLINEYDQQDKCMPWKALAAGSMIAKAQAAAELLAMARERFCQSVVTGKVLGELAAESVAQTQAKQAGVRQPAGTFIVGRDGRMQIFLVDHELDEEYLGNGNGGGGGGGGGGCGGGSGSGSGGGGGSAGGGSGDGAGPSRGGGNGAGGAVAAAGGSSSYGADILWDGKNGGVPRKCMALKYTSTSLEQCKNNATLVYDPEDEGSSPAGQRRKHVVCVCTAHGEGSSAVLQSRDLRYPARQLDDLRVIDSTAIRLGQNQEQFRQCLRMTAEQARKYTSATDWCALQRELQKKKPVNSRYRCAHGNCSAVPKRFYADHRPVLLRGRQHDQVDLICVCGKAGCNIALDASSDWKLVYTHESLRGRTRQRDMVDRNMKDFIEWASQA